MDERSSRLLLGLAVLVVLWIGVYWLWEPGGSNEPRISFAEVSRPADAPPKPVRRDPPPPERREPAPAPPLTISERPALELPARDEPRPRAVEPPRFRDYAVRAGDTFGRIAAREFGSARHADAIARANPLKDPRRLRVGEVIRIPVDPDNIQGRPVGDRETERPPRSDPGAGLGVEYTVQTGDTLSGIARAFYGSIQHTDFLFEANRDRLSSVDSLRVGQVIIIPPHPDGASGPGR